MVQIICDLKLMAEFGMSLTTLASKRKFTCVIQEVNRFLKIINQFIIEALCVNTKSRTNPEWYPLELCHVVANQVHFTLIRDLY